MASFTRLVTTAATPGGPSAGTVTLPGPPSSSSSSSLPPEKFVLRLSRPGKKVRWKEGTVDNEFLGRKSSKKCSSFHKRRPFDEDGSDDDDVEVDGGGSVRADGAEKGDGAGSSSCCASHGTGLGDP